MDSRFRGNDVISARHVAFRLAVIPAKAGIHFGQRIQKLEHGSPKHDGNLLIFTASQFRPITQMQ